MSQLSSQAVAARGQRIRRVRERMDELGVDALLLSHGADLPWLTGYQAMPLERLTMLVLPRAGDPVLVVPALEAPRVAAADTLFSLLPWSDSEDPIERVVSLLTATGNDRAACLAISDRAWATTVLALQHRLPEAGWRESSGVTSPIRAVKDAEEQDVLRAAGAAADRVAAALQAGEIALSARPRPRYPARLAALLVDEGHRHVNFAIVGSGPNGASPHHEAGARVIGRDETVVCDFGGTSSTRVTSATARTSPAPSSPGRPRPRWPSVTTYCTRPSRQRWRRPVPVSPPSTWTRWPARIISEAGFGHLFVHRTGHGIGIEEHEDPYLVAGNTESLRPGHAFSVEPGIYWPGRFGMRLEDIVVIDDQGPAAQQCRPRPGRGRRLGKASGMDLGIKGKAALVVAGSRGLGRASAEALASEGARVMVSARSAEALDAVRSSLRSQGAEVEMAAADITDPSAPAALVEATVAAFGDRRYRRCQRRRAATGPGPRGR